MHDVTHYSWMQRPERKPDATTLPSARHQNGAPVFWTADRDLSEAMAAPLGGKSVAVEVYANHGRWIVECPVCHDAQLASRDDHRFMCVGCGNASIGGVWRPVVWPKNHAAIEALLDERPRHLANALPGETLEQIRKENKLLSKATLIGGHT